MTIRLVKFRTRADFEWEVGCVCTGVYPHGGTVNHTFGAANSPIKLNQWNVSTSHVTSDLVCENTTDVFKLSLCLPSQVAELLLFLAIWLIIISYLIQWVHWLIFNLTRAIWHQRVQLSWEFGDVNIELMTISIFDQQSSQWMYQYLNISVSIYS